MSHNLQNIKYINLHENRKVGSLVLNPSVPLPIETGGAKKAEDLDLNSLVAGLIKVIAWDEDNKNLEYYKSILKEMQPNAAVDLNKAAVAKSAANEFDFALELMLAVNHLANTPESYVNLAVLYAQMTVFYHKNNEDAKADMYDDKILEILEKCRAAFPEFAPVYSEISAFHLRHGNVESSREALELFVKYSPEGDEKKKAAKTLESLNNMVQSKDRIIYAYDKMASGCSDEAIKITDEYLAVNKTSWEALFIRGWAKRTIEDFAGAEKDLLESIKLDSSNAEVYNELALCVQSRGEEELAESYLQIACDLDPESAVYASNLAFLLLRRGKYAEAKEAIVCAHNADSNDPDIEYLVKEYESKTGEPFGEFVVQEVYSDADFEKLHEKEHEGHEKHEEI